MSIKPKFNPAVTQIKLNPEQAVLACTCYSGRRSNTGRTSTAAATVCSRSTRRTNYCNQATSATVS